MNRILFFVHYNKYNSLEDYIIYLLENIKILYSRIVFISNSKLNDQQILMLKGLYNSLIIRENKGFDFGAWKDALLQEGWENLAAYDNVTIMNDSCFGPFYDMEIIYNRMEQNTIDFWGISDFSGMNYGMPEKKGPIPKHIQSYFLCFKKKIINSLIFKYFWENIDNERNINTVIQKYETQLTSILKENGFNYTVLIQSGKEINIAFDHPDFCIINEIPLIKIKSVYFSRNPLYIKELIKTKTSYPVFLIDKYFSNIYDPTSSFKIINNIVNLELYPININEVLFPKIAVHININDPEIFQDYIPIFDKWEIEYHLFITTDTDFKKKEIIDYMENHISYNNVKELIVIKNNEKDILFWLKIAEKLNKYEIAGNFNIRDNFYKTPDCFKQLLIPINKIINLFTTNEKIGIIISDLPDHFMQKSFINLKEKKRRLVINNLWKKMECKKEVNFKELSMAIFSYENSFWYRPPALSPLVNLLLINNNFKKKYSNFIIDCVNMMLVYIAWSEGFDFRVCISGMPQESSYYTNIIFNDYFEKYFETQNIEKSLLFIFIFVKSILRKIKRTIKIIIKRDRKL
jgi:rhamnosyltransferase